jgi:toxin ParE1/3/4
MNLTKETENKDPILQFSPFALTDIKGTWQYLLEQGEEASARLIKEVTDKCGLLARNPKIGRERNDLIINLRQFPFKKYNIYYFPIENGVEIYRVLHSSRDNVQVFDDTIDEIK